MNDELRRRLADITDYYSMAEHKHSEAVRQIQAHRGVEHQLNDKVAKYEEEVKRLVAAREHDSLLMDELRAGHQVIWPARSFSGTTRDPKACVTLQPHRPARAPPATRYHAPCYFALLRRTRPYAACGPRDEERHA